MNKTPNGTGRSNPNGAIRAVITGASGYLAHRLIPIASSRASIVGIARDSSCVVTPASAYSIDLANRQQVLDFIREINPHVIIHAASANPGRDENVMQAANHLAARHIALAATTVGARLVAVSTDIIHSGRHAPYADDAPALPLNRYGETKAQGEAAIRLTCPSAAIVRTSLIYGLEQIDRGTAGFLDRLQRGETLTLFNDVIRQPVWIDSLARGLCHLAFDAVHVRGTLNIAGDQAMSRAEFGRAMLGYWGADTASGQIIETTGGSIDGLPLDLRLRCDHARALGLEMPGVDTVLTAASRKSFDL